MRMFELLDHMEDISQLESTMNLIIESAIPKVDLRHIPDKYKKVFLESSTSDMIRKKHPSGLLLPYVERCNIVSYIIPYIEQDFVSGVITESEYKALKKDLKAYIESFLDMEFTIGAMLPQPVEKGCQQRINEEDEELDGEDLDDKIELDEAVVDYINQPNYDYSIYVEAGVVKFVKKIGDKVGNKIKLSSKQLKVIADRAALKSKIRIAKMKKADPTKIKELERQLIQKEQDARTLKNGISPEVAEELDNVAAKIDATIRKKEEEKKDDISDQEIKQLLSTMESYAENVVIRKPADSHDVFSESYFGKSPILEQAEDILGQLLVEIKKDPMEEFNNHPLNKKFEELMKKQFGFRTFYMIWDRHPLSIPSGFTFINSNILFSSDDILFVKDKRKGFYDKKHKHTAYIEMSTSIVKYMDLSKSEMMAIILHEFGHNFDKTIYNALRVLICYVNKISMVLANPASLPSTVINTLPDFSIGKQAVGTWRQFGDKVRDYLTSRIPALKKINDIFNKIIDGYVRVFEILFSPIAFVQLPLYVLMSPWMHLATVLTRKGEVFADSFATSYGYSVELGTALSKMEKSNIINYSKPRKKPMNTVQRWCYDLVLMEREIVSFAIAATHGNTSTRITACKEALERDIQLGQYPPELKNELKKNIRDLESLYEKTQIITDNDGTQFAMASFVRKLINKLFNGNSTYIEKLFPNAYVIPAVESAEFYKSDFYDLVVEKEELEELLKESEEKNNLPLIHGYENKLKRNQLLLERCAYCIYEAANIDTEIKPIIEMLNKKGYKTKYSSAGHTRLRKKEDRYRDGVYKGELYSDARIMFDDDYNFPKAPKHWKWRNVEGKDYLDIDPKGYHITKGDTPDEAFGKWKAMYMGTLRTWVENLPDRLKTDNEVQTKDTKGRVVNLESAYVQSIKDFDEFFEASIHEIDNDLMEDGNDSVIIYE